MSELMANLAENYQMGIIIISAIFILIYALICIFSIRRVYKLQGVISLMGMIPLVNIFLLFKGRKKPKKNLTSVKKDANLESDSKDDIIDDIF